MDTNALENALKQIQAWFVSGEFEKVVRGCKEILNVAPNNSIAQDLLKKAEESMTATAPAPTPQPVPQPAAPAPTPTPMAAPMTMPTPEPQPIPQPAPQPAPAPMAAPIPMPAATSMPMMPEEHHKLHSILVNLAILVGIVVIGFGVVLGYNTFFKEKETQTPAPVETTTPEVTEPDGKPGTTEETPEEISEEETNAIDEVKTLMETQNAQRSADLTGIENALIHYYEKFKKYPEATALETELATNGYLDALPKPPTADEKYMYAVYTTPLGPNQKFILSAEFQEETGPTIWTTGENISDYPDYRDDSLPNVLAITQEGTTSTVEPTVPSTENNTPTEIRVPRTPRTPKNTQ